MATLSTAAPRDLGLYRHSELSWSAIFAGCFMFLAIEVTFGVLGTAIFASAANPRSANPVGGMSTGIGIWLVVLTIISMYFAGKTASRVSGTNDRNLGMYHGLVTFGMSIFATVLVLSMAMGSSASTVNPGRFGAGTIANAVSTAGWWLFAALVLGFIAASVGGTHGVQSSRNAQEPVNIDRNLRAA
jgi:hypothetical protein